MPVLYVKVASDKLNFKLYGNNWKYHKLKSTSKIKYNHQKTLKGKEDRKTGEKNKEQIEQGNSDKMADLNPTNYKLH